MEKERMQFEAVDKDKSIIVTDTNIYNIQSLPPLCCLTNTNELNTSDAYLEGDYFYLYRGERPKGTPNLKPGIYVDSISKEPYKVDPENEQEQQEYDVNTHLESVNPIDIIDLVNQHEDMLVAVPGSTKVFMPTIDQKDDILKRLCKQALILKNVDLDKVKDRFSDKNALFNFKQVLKGDNKVSILIFDRGMDALGLQYKIIISEKNPSNPIGEGLEKPIEASSEDTYEMYGKVA